MSDLLDDQTEAAPRAGFSRRKLLIGTGVGAIAVVAAACGSDDDAPAASGNPSTSTTETTMGGSDSGDASGDAAVAQVAASLEVLAVGTYQAALDAATAGSLGAVPPAVAAFIGRAMEQHQAALDAWNGVLTDGGGTAVTEPPADLKATVDTEFGKVKDVVGAAKLALLLEQTAADTYLSAVPGLKDPAAITLAAALQCADQEHTAILHYVLGEYPVPDVFQTTKNAYAA